MVWWLLCPAALAAGTFATCGGVGLELLVGQAAIGVLLLEIINYVEARPAWSTGRSRSLLANRESRLLRRARVCGLWLVLYSDAHMVLFKGTS